MPAIRRGIPRYRLAKAVEEENHIAVDKKCKLTFASAHVFNCWLVQSIKTQQQRVLSGTEAVLGFSTQGSSARHVWLAHFQHHRIDACLRTGHATTLRRQGRKVNPRPRLGLP